VQNANYIAPANPLLEPLWIPPSGIKLPQLPKKPPTAPAVAPAFISPVQQGPIFATGMAIPAPGPIILPVRRRARAGCSGCARGLPRRPARADRRAPL
jgi:hypothetical protein